MRQVPRVLIIGAGKAAKHFSYYFQLLNIPCLQWSRQVSNSSVNLFDLVNNCDRILILISDVAIESFINEHSRILKNKILIHCSGQLVTPLAYGAHPLMTFANELYTLADYQQIPFILDKGAPGLHELLPGLPNPHYFIDSKEKPFYHSLCVISGNFTTMLWQKFYVELLNRLNVPAEVIKPYLKAIFDNLHNNPQLALTGPLARGDNKTITANLNALENDPFQKVYQAFVEAYQAIKMLEN